MEMKTTASLDSAAAASVPASSSGGGDAKQATNDIPTPAAVVDAVADEDDHSSASPSPLAAQPQAPQTPSLAPGVKHGSITTAAERERVAREVLAALTASSSLASSANAVVVASGGKSGGSAEASTCSRRVLFTADDADSEEDFASDDSDAIERALRRAKGRPASGGGGGGGGAVWRSAAARTAATVTAAAAATAAPKASSLQPANASARRLDAVFDGALRQAYFHGSGNEDDDDDFDDFDDNAGGGAGNASGKGGSSGSGNHSSSTSMAARNRDKSDRATVETVLDPRTRLVLFKLLNNGVFASIHGCVSTGKEANVYLALPGPSRASSQFDALAVKVYKTSILAFKDRERYVEGDARFSGSNGGGGGGGGGGFGGGGGKGASSRAGYCRGNARKMVRAWAEKEARNLARLAAAGVRAPAVVCLRSHVLAMEFVSDGSSSGANAAPRLKYARLSRSRAATAYKETLGAMRAMWSRARLVHADLSEYNMLYAPVKRRAGEEEEEAEGEEGEAEGEEEAEAEGGGGDNGDGDEAGSENDGDEAGGENGDKKPKKKQKKEKKKRTKSKRDKPPTHSVVVIDVSQSVDLDHPRALEFLRVDAGNVNSFFARRGVPPLTMREVFDFVTADAAAYPDGSEGGERSSSSSSSSPAAAAPTPSVKASPFTAATAATATFCADFDPGKTCMMTRGEEAFLDALLDKAGLRSEASVASGGALAPEQSSADVVWASAHIPRRLADVFDAEGDAARLAKGGEAAEGIYYQRFAGMTEDMGKVRIEEEEEEEEEENKEEAAEKEKEKKKEQKRKKKKNAVSFAAAADGGGGKNGGGRKGDEEEEEGASDSDASSSAAASSDSDSEFSDSEDSDASDSSQQRLYRRSLKARACTLPQEEADAARAARKAAKAEAKAGARERRKTKTPKHVKKRAAAKARKKKK